MSATTNKLVSRSMGHSTRREFLTSAAVATGAAVLAIEAPGAPKMGEGDHGLVDVNVSLGRWPFRRLPGDEPAELVARLRARGVAQAWAGSFDGLLHKDLTAVNARLADDCQKYGRGLLLPFGSINPRLPGWEDAVRICVEEHHMRGIRLHPNYHGYPLDDPAFTRLLKLATERGLVVQVALVMEDERMMHPLVRVLPVDPAPLADIVRQTPGLRLVLVNALRTLRGPSLQKLVSAGEVFVEISMLEGVGGISALLRQVPVSRILFGSLAPLFYFVAAKLKLKESLLTPDQLHAIRRENAQRLFAVNSQP